MKAYYCSNHNRLLSPLRFVRALLLACFATVLTSAPIPTVARDQLPFNGTVSGSGTVPTVSYALFTFGAFSKTSELPPLGHPNPVVAKATQIRGATGTGSCGGGYDLGVGLVDLDHGLGAGATTYDHGGFLWCETYAPYLWSEQNGGSTLFKLQGEYNWEHSTYIPSGMTPDGSTVVGGVIFFDRGTGMPWMWTAGGASVEFLGLPNGYTGGNAVAVSNDRRIVAGYLYALGAPVLAQQQCGAMVVRGSCPVLSCGRQLAVIRSTSTLPTRCAARTR